MDTINFDNVTCVWKPTKPFKKSKFINSIEDKYHVKFDSYWDLHKWSVENYLYFWAEILDLSKVKFSKKYDQVIENVPFCDVPKWFVGAKLNFAENLLVHKDDHVAIIAIGEDRDKNVVTYAEFYNEVKRYAAALRKFGLKRGDRFVGYMSNREEAVFAMLAVVSIGAIWAGVLPLLGAQAVLNLLDQIKPNIILSVNRYCFKGEEINMLPKLKEISMGSPTLEKVIVISTKLNSTEKDICEIPKSCFLEEFLKIGENQDGSFPDIIFEQVSFSDPVFIHFTSGTTGKPKPLVHGTGSLFGFLNLPGYYDNLTRESIILQTSPPGWISWCSASYALYSGFTTLLFDGEPFYLSPTHYWDLVEEYKLSAIFLSSTHLDEFEKKGIVPTEKHSLSHLHIIISGASVVKPNNYNFVNRKIKPDVFFIVPYNSTETQVPVMSVVSSLPIYMGEIQCPCLGMDVQIIDEKGMPVVGEIGDLVLGNPMPLLPLGLYGDTDGSKYKETYFAKYSDKFSLGDYAVKNPKTKGFVIIGRNDEVLKQFNARYGSSEIYNVVNQLQEVLDSLVVSQYSKDRTERAVLFVKLRNGWKLDKCLVQKIERTIHEELTMNHVPGLIMEVPDIPCNLNGKKMEGLVKKIINKMPYSADMVRNKESLQPFFNVPPFEPLV